MTPDPQRKEYICLEHGYNACPDCVKDFRSLEQQLSEKDRRIEELERVADRLSKNCEHEKTCFVYGGYTQSWVKIPESKCDCGLIEVRAEYREMRGKP
jgi:hypothetical protein